MYLSAQSAQQIAMEISAIVKQNINVMNERGYIIASTDPLRIGQFHEGASRVITQGLSELYITPEQETETVRAGLNLPIRVGRKIVGVVGITGGYEQILSYGQIVKKMTEILVLEKHLQEQERYDKRIQNRFLEDWILRGGMEKDPDFAERGIALHVDILRPRRVMVLRLEDFHSLSATGKGQQLIEQVEQAVQEFICQEPGNVFLRLATKQICLVDVRSNEQMVRLAQQVTDCIHERFGVWLLVGIDSETSDTLDMKQAYTQANKASHACRAPLQRITLYDQINLEIFTKDIPARSKKEYLKKIFKQSSPKDMRYWIGLLEAYFAAEGSISLAAEKLFMHKNTLQYKLKKLYAQTGYDVRHPSSGALFYMAVLFFRDMEDELF